MRGSARSRTREDRAGDPLDGLVNLFEGPATRSTGSSTCSTSASCSRSASARRLSSLDISPAEVERAEPGAVIVKPGEEVATIELAPGERTEGPGEEVGRVYRLEDGRTILVRPR